MTKIDETSAADSLKPGSNPSVDPKSKVERIAAMIGAANAMKDDQFTKWWDETLARAKEIGHGPGIPDGAAAHNKSTIETHKEAVASDVDKMLSEDESFSEEFKTKVRTLFEAALETRIALAEAELEEAFEVALEEAVEEAVGEIAEGTKQFLEYAAEEWMTENEVAIESSLRNELASDFMAGLRQLFIENNINIPEEQVELVDTMAEKIDELEARLNDSISENADLRAVVEEFAKQETVAKVCEGLTLAETEKLRELAENIEFETAEEFETKLKTIRESQFVKTPKPSTLNEQLEEVDENNAPEQVREVSPEMKRYTDAISRSLKKA